MENDKVKKTISLDEITKKAKGNLVEIPDWEPGKFISVRLKTIDVTPLLIGSGVIPNQLSLEVATMFADEASALKDGIKTGVNTPNMDTSKFIGILETVAKEALAEPTYDEITKIYPLTLQQKLAILKYVTGGIEKLKPFR